MPFVCCLCASTSAIIGQLLLLPSSVWLCRTGQRGPPAPRCAHVAKAYIESPPGCCLEEGYGSIPLPMMDPRPFDATCQISSAMRSGTTMRNILSAQGLSPDPKVVLRSIRILSSPKLYQRLPGSAKASSSECRRWRCQHCGRLQARLDVESNGTSQADADESVLLGKSKYR